MSETCPKCDSHAIEKTGKWRSCRTCNFNWCHKVDEAERIRTAPGGEIQTDDKPMPDYSVDNADFRTDGE